MLIFYGKNIKIGGILLKLEEIHLVHQFLLVHECISVD